MAHISLIAPIALHAGEPVTAGEYLVRVLLTVGAFGGIGTVLYWVASIVDAVVARPSGGNRSDEGSL